MALRWADLSEDYSYLKVQRSIKEVTIIDSDRNKVFTTVIQPPKTKNSIRAVPIPTSLINILNEHKQMQDEERNKVGSSYINNDFIFTTEQGKYINSSNFRKSYKRILKGAGITYKKFHAQRHTYATKLFQKNEHIKTVSELLGHSDISITANIYTHVTPETKSFAAEKLNLLFE